MHTRFAPRALHAFTRALAALLILIACGKDGDHYAPLPDKPATQKSTVVAGAVRDASDHVVSDALVVIEPASEGIAASASFMAENPSAAPESTPGRRVAVTDEAGFYAFPSVEAGDYFLQVIADNHLGASRAITVPDPIALVDTIIVDVDLTPTGTFTGVATLENAGDHQGTVVYAEGTSYVAVTDPSGNYALTDVPVGTYTVRAAHAHYLPDTKGGTITTAGQVVPLASMLLRIDSNIPPTATIVSASPQVDNTPVNFVASGSDVDGTVVLYEWDWEDDGVFDYSSASTANTTHTYAMGTYRAKLRVTDDDGAIGLAVIDLNIVSYIYMSWRGSDTDPGTATQPVATLTKAYQLAQASGAITIFVEEGSYSGAPVFLGGIEVRGGRTWPTWVEGANTSVFTFSASRGTANNIATTTLIRRVRLVMTLPAGGTNSIALYSLGSSSSLRFEQCEFVAANGVVGTNGGGGFPGSTGNAGGNGGIGFCDTGPPGSGGIGGSSPAGCPGGNGGSGGAEGANNGATGNTGACGGGAGGSGGAGGDPGGTGGTGINGAPGNIGSGGASAGSAGLVVANEWVPGTSTNGGIGGNGRGGGGGGGGGGQGGTFIDDGAGNGGGGGGGGGGAGTGGGGAGGGRASFAVMLVSSHPVFDSCRFESGVGGTGGNGGSGGSGGSGGPGGAGGANCIGEVGRGGNGGPGGSGGQGGGGAGGPGGPSYGIYRSASAPTIISPVYVIGGGGTGGSGGIPNGAAGLAGVSGNIF